MRQQQIYTLEHLGCAHCASKMEEKIKQLPEVKSATIVFATKQLRVEVNTKEELLEKFQEICTSIEDGVIVRKEEVINNREESMKNKREYFEIGIGVILLLLGFLLQSSQAYVSNVILLLSYFVLGKDILLSAAKNIKKGHVFDENFLMSVATLAAIVIGEYTEAVGVILFFRIGELFEESAVERSRKQIMEAVDLRPEVVNRINSNGNVEEIPAKEAKVGDIVLVRAGDRIPMEGIIVEGESQVDTSPVTGESIPISVREGDQVISGCVNISGILKLKVERVLEDSMVTRILHSVENAAASKPKMDRFITRFSRVYTPFVVILALLTATIPSFITGDWEYWVYTAITFLVISCPCALVLSVPLAFFSGIGAGSKKGILFKGGLSIEALQGVKAVVMDKTGTITQGNFEVQRILTSGEFGEDELLQMAGSCEMNSTHPIAVSIVSELKKRGLKLVSPEKTEEISGKGICALLGERTILCGNKQLLESYQIHCEEHQEDNYGTEVFVAVDGRYAGRILISDTIKSDAKQAIDTIKRQNITTAILTGDTIRNAQAVAAEVGIDEVHAKLLPEEKVSELQKIRNTYGNVMFVGDGINDAPVLAGADVGAAMGSGADAAIEAADVVFMSSSVEAIPQSLQIAKVTAAISKQNVIFAITIKVLIMILGLLGMANMWMAVFADTGVAVLCILNSVRILYKKF
ncbi:MAG: cadmium-translocating P-type ATPase [Candidatus Ruminococcus intestinipullorum]|nr:cadmium-translocating P-type ATPase [Candidatus Ruminococcus intestinipullorum]